MKLNRNRLMFAVSGLFVMAILTPSLLSQSNAGISEIERRKKSAENEIKETKAEIGANEKKVNEGLSALRKIDEDIAVSENEIATVQGQLSTINTKIGTLQTGIESHESDLQFLREEYLKAVKKMRVARKQNSSLAFLFASHSFNEARRRMRYMKEFSDWKDRRSGEILDVVTLLQKQRGELEQAKSDAAVALKREEAAKEKLNLQKTEQQAAVATLRQNGEALRSKLAKRQSEARQLSNQISALIAEQRAKEEAEKRKKEEARRLAEEKAAAEKKAAEEKRLAEEKQAAEKQRIAEEKRNKSNAKEETKPSKGESKVVKSEYAEARKRQPRTSSSPDNKSTQASTGTTAQAQSDFAGMQGRLPKPVSGPFKIVSAFGVHPISPELPDIMDENLGIDAHVANGASVTAVYDGEVIKIYDRTNTPGFRNIIVVKHGDYITVYANMETLAVKTGQHVKQGQVLGTVGSDFDDPKYGMLHFEVWKNQTHLNPASWIKI